MFGPYRKLFSMLEDRVVEWCNKAKSGMKEENDRDIHIEWFQTIQIKLILLCVYAEPAVFFSTRTALKFKYGI